MRRITSIFTSGRVKQELGNHDVDECEKSQSSEQNDTLRRRDKKYKKYKKYQSTGMGGKQREVHY